MKKTWNITIILCWIMILGLVVGWCIFLLPNYITYRVFAKVDAGNWGGVTKEYNALSDVDKNRVKANLEDFATVIAQQYIDGDRDFVSTAASFDTIAAIDSTGELYDKYMKDICENEYRRGIRELQKANIIYDGALQNQSKLDLEAVQKRLDNTERERIMISMLNEQYYGYLQGTISEEEIGILLNIVTGLAVYDARDYVEVIRENLSSVRTYRKYYDEAKAAYDAQNYFQALNICNQLEIDPMDTAYVKKVEELKQASYDGGLIYYNALLDDYVDLEDAANANKLINQMAETFPDDFDAEASKLRLALPWQKTYLDIIANAGDIVQMNAGDDAEAPDKLYLRDLDGDGVPELFLFNSKDVGDDYTVCYCFTFSGKKEVYAGEVLVASFCDDEHILSIPSGAGDASEAYSLLTFNGKGFGEQKSCYKSGSEYYVDGAKSTDVDYLAAQSECLEHSIGKGLKLVKSKPLKEGETYILTYEAED